MNFIDLGLYTDMMIAYDEYIEKCEENQTEILSFQDWWDSLE